MNLSNFNLPKKSKIGKQLQSKKPSMKKFKPELAQQLDLITMSIYPHMISFKADKSLNIKEQLIINSNTKEIYYQEKIIDQCINQVPFCYLIGIIDLKKNLYIVLVKSCIPHKLIDKNIYQVQEVFAWNVQKREHNKILSDLLTDYYAHDFWFSYDIDLTHSENITSCLNNTYDYKTSPKKSLLFYTNFAMHCPLIKNHKTEWCIPLICGYFYDQKVFDVRNGCEATCWLIYKKSINSIYNSFDFQHNKDYPFVYEFNCDYDTFDIYTGNIGQIYKQQFILCKNPKEETIDRLLIEHRCSRFVEFMRKSLGATLFFFNNRKLWDFISFNNISSHDYFFVENYQQFSIRVPKMIQKSILNRNDQVFCLVYEKIQEEIQIFFNNYFENIPETPRIQNFQRKRNSLFNNLIFTNIQLCQESEVVYNTLSIVKDTNIQLSNKVESIQKVKQYLKTEEKIDINIKLNKDKKYINQKLRELIDSDRQIVLNQKEASIILITHNCSGVPKKSINDLINYSKYAQQKQIDFVVIGLQEIVEMKGKNLSNILLNDNQLQSEYWKNLLLEEFDDYVLIGEVSMLGLMTLILQNKQTLKQYNCKIIKSKLIKQGFMQMANKGGVIIVLQINWYVISILNLHLPSGTKKQDFKKRIENLSFFENYLGKKNYVNLKIILGDFNFRNQFSAQTMLQYIQKYQQDDSQKTQILQDMLKGDEYLDYRQKNHKKELPYEEQPITFLPSYKFYPNSKDYFTKDGKRSPSWTDRIFYDSQNIPLFSELVYNSDRQTIFSDHRQFKKTSISKSKNKC